MQPTFAEYDIGCDIFGSQVFLMVKLDSEGQRYWEIYQRDRERVKTGIMMLGLTDTNLKAIKDVVSEICKSSE